MVCEFSIVVPSYRRAEHLANLLDSLTHLEYPLTLFEVIVVDDGGEIPLDSICGKFKKKLNLTLLSQKNAGPAAARNLGASRASGKYLAFTDDDCLVHPKWLSALAAGFKKSPSCICGGRTINALTNNTYSTASQMLTDYLYEHYSPVHEPGGFFCTNNFSVSKQALLEMGGFDASLRFGEDRDFCYRWTCREQSFCAVPNAVVYHVHDLNFSSFLRLHYCYGGGTYEFRKRCAIRGLDPVKISPPSFYLRLLLSGITKEKNPRGLFLSFLLFLTQVSNTCGFFMTRRGQSFR